MSLVGTLGKVALGMVVAKGVGSVLNKGAGGGGLGGLLGGAGGAGGLGSLLGGAGGAAGGLGSLLGGAQGGAQQGGAAGGLGGLLGGAAQGGGAGGLGGLLNQLGGAAGGAGAAGGLGGMLNSALQGEPPAEQPSQQQEETAKVLIKAMVNAAKSDGQIDQAEQEKIVSNLGEEVSEEERNFVLSEMQAPLDLQGLLSEVPAGSEQQVYLMSLMAIDLDSQAEAQYLDKLREGMGMDKEATDAIHTHLGVPKLYS